MPSRWSPGISCPGSSDAFACTLVPPITLTWRGTSNPSASVTTPKEVTVAVEAWTGASALATMSWPKGAAVALAAGEVEVIASGVFPPPPPPGGAMGSGASQAASAPRSNRTATLRRFHRAFIWFLRPAGLEFERIANDKMIASDEPGRRRLPGWLGMRSLKLLQYNYLPPCPGSSPQRSTPSNQLQGSIVTPVIRREMTADCSGVYR